MSRDKHKGGTSGTKNRKSLRPKKEGSDNGHVFWSQAPVTNLVDVIDVVTKNGGAIMFNRSADGGTLGIRIYHDHYEVETLWSRPDEDCRELLDSLYNEFSGMGQNGAK